MTTHGMPNNEVKVVYIVDNDGISVAELELPADSEDDDGEEPFAERLAEVQVDAGPGESRDRLINRFKLAVLEAVVHECSAGRVVPDLIAFQKKPEN